MRPQRVENKADLFGGNELLNALPQATIVIDRSDHICFANHAAETFFEQSTSFLVKLKLDELVPFDSPLISLVAQARDRQSSINEYDVEISTRKTKARPVDALVTPVPDNPSYTMLQFQDRGMADRITRQITHRDATRSVVGMAMVLAHEIKNPLAGIRGAAQLLEQSLPADEINLTALIRDEADRICDLVDRMEVFADRQPIDYEPVNIHAILDHVVDVAQMGFGADIEILKDYDPSLPEIGGDRNQLIQVFMNLLSNAAHAVEQSERPSIRLTTAYRPGVKLSLPGSGSRVNLPLEVQVIDNGPGIPEELMPSLFDPFVTTKRSGKGLGLALVSKIVRDHGGVVECENHPKGALFRILLPLGTPRTQSE